MVRNRSEFLKRIASSAVIALPMTVALLFLMTRLILPDERDPVVNRMIQEIELERADQPPAPFGIQIFELPPTLRPEPPPRRPTLSASRDTSRDIDEEVARIETADETPAHVIDWWAAARSVGQTSDEEAFERWLIEQGYEKYVSIMQGPLPITNSVRAELPITQEDITGYMNTYGDMELKISDNCVIQSLISTRFDMSDFAKNLPMRVVCKPRKKERYSFERD